MSPFSPCFDVPELRVPVTAVAGAHLRIAENAGDRLHEIFWRLTVGEPVVFARMKRTPIFCPCRAQGAVPCWRGLNASVPSLARSVLITGAAGGLGRALVAEFAAQGWQVAAAWHREPVETASENIWPVRLDVTDKREVAEVFEALLQRFGRLDALVNNAGIAADALVAQMSLDAWQRVLDVNLKGAFLCSQVALRSMLQQRTGHIINIGSFGGRVGRAGQANYAASKAALLGLTQSLAHEVGSRNVQVNAVLPGFLRTKLVGTLSEEDWAAHAAANTLGRLNDLTEVARFLVFLAAMRNVSGQIFQLDSRIAPWT